MTEGLRLSHRKDSFASQVLVSHAESELVMRACVAATSDGRSARLYKMCRTANFGI